MLKIINVDRVGTLPGGTAQPYDRAIVVNTACTEANILTGQAQPLVVYRGDLAGAHVFVEASR